MLSPGKFIPLAEATGLIVPLGEWVLGEACRRAAAWQAQGHSLQVSVNQSTRARREVGDTPIKGKPKIAKIATMSRHIRPKSAPI
jgi:EAL domain-containing protein (putative c-di-GMP-specific phosphodiesterase class I)